MGKQTDERQEEQGVVDLHRGPGFVFTTLHFLLNLFMGPKARALDNTILERLSNYKHSSLLGTFVSCKENEMF